MIGRTRDVPPTTPPCERSPSGFDLTAPCLDSQEITISIHRRYSAPGFRQSHDAEAQVNVMTTMAVALIAIGLLVTVAIFIRKPAEHRRAHVTVAELQARLADESGPEHARADEEEAAEETGAAAADFEPEAPEERGPIAPEEFGPGRADEQAPGEAAESAPSD